MPGAHATAPDDPQVQLIHTHALSEQHVHCALRLVRPQQTTPVRYLWAARVRLGVHLLENTDLPVAEIACRAGCKSPKHFTRLVRASLGAPPREVRKRTLAH